MVRVRVRVTVWSGLELGMVRVNAGVRVRVRVDAGVRVRVRVNAGVRLEKESGFDKIKQQ